MITLNKYSIGYAAIPKVATTSIKGMIYELEHGAPPPGETALQRQAPSHAAFQSVPFKKPSWLNREKAFNFIVLRDPAARILSCYTEKVLMVDRLTQLNKQRQQELTAKGIDPRTATTVLPPLSNTLDPRPGLDGFVMNLGSYRNLYGPIRMHTQPVQYYSGPDLGFFTRVYKLNEMADLEADLRDFTKVQDLSIPVSYSSSHRFKRSVSDLSKKAYDHLMWWLEPEYEFLKDYFTPPPHKAD